MATCASRIVANPCIREYKWKYLILSSNVADFFFQYRNLQKEKLKVDIELNLKIWILLV